MNKERIIGSFNFGRIPKEDRERIRQAVENRDWKTLAVANHNYKLSPWDYCCSSDDKIILKIFDEANETGLLED